MVYLRVEARLFNFLILNVYVATENATEEDKDNIYDKLEEELE